MTTDVNVEIAQLQKDIENHIGPEPHSVVFNYEDVDGKTRLDVITVNARHNQSFLFHSVIGYDKSDALKTMYAYVKQYRDSESSYTIQWTLRGDQDLHTSYFRAHNILEAIDKLHYDRDPNSITIFSVVLNPIA
jgi:hypothetical protein